MHGEACLCTATRGSVTAGIYIQISQLPVSVAEQDSYMMWRVLMGLHHRISIHFLVAGHTKFSPDWCFGLLKQRFRRTPVSSLEQLAECVRNSTLKRVNVPQIVGSENGPADVPSYDCSR